MNVTPSASTEPSGKPPQITTTGVTHTEIFVSWLSARFKRVAAAF